MCKETKLEATHVTFLELVKDYFIEIPKIQRDYAQGRQSEKVKEIRTAFLEQLKSYLDSSNAENDLDFIYGDEVINGEIEDNNAKRKNLIVLDGQQRLTTLFLLHWYTALVAGKSEDFKKKMIEGDSSRFSYNTRESSSSFCFNLVDKADDLENIISLEYEKNHEAGINGIKLSEIIKDQKWFYLNWINDLTIQSMLVMIDSISSIFGCNKEYYDKLIGRSITFYFLPLKSQGFSDDMYIRMNSRGRELTRFENLKSKLLDKFDKIIECQNFDPDKYSLEKILSLRSNFAIKLDTDWLDLFWDLNNKTNSSQFDSSLLVFFETIFIGKYATMLTRPNSINKNYSLSKLENFIKKPKNISFKELLNDELFLDIINDLNIILSSLTIKIDDTVQYRQYLPSNSRYNEIVYIKKFMVNDKVTYKERAIFYAYYSYLIKHWNENSKKVVIDIENDFEHWMRIIINLLENQEHINYWPQSFINAIYSINYMLNKCQDNVYENFIDIKFDDLKSIDKIQFYEEQLKVKLICDKDKKSCNWESSILNAEKHTYFKGQIGFALSYATAPDNPKSFANDEILTITEQNIPKIISKIRKDEFDRIINITFKLFDEKGLSSVYNTENCFRRAMTIISDSFYMRWGDSNWSLIANRQSYSRFNWKYYLKRELFDDEHIAYYYMLIKDDLFDENDITSSLERICREKISDKKPQSILIATHPQLFDKNQKQGMRFNNRYLIRWDGNNDKDENVYILKGERMNGEHSELRTLCKYYDLNNKIRISPFSEMGYYIVSRKEDTPCLYLNKWIVADKYNFAIDCVWNQNKYSFMLKFFDRKGASSNEWPESILNVLKSYEFNDYEDPCKGKILLRLIKEDDKSFELDELLENLCKSLDGIPKDL